MGADSIAHLAPSDATAATKQESLANPLLLPSALVQAADSCSSASSSHMEADVEISQRIAGAGLLATVRSRLIKPWSALQASWLTSGMAPTAELQGAVLAAYAEVLAGAKLNFGELYRMGHMLGTGHYARVHQATSAQGSATYAVKVLPKATNRRKARQQLQKVVKEVAIMRLLADHPCAVQLHQVLQDKQNYYLVMEHCSGGELFDYVYKVDRLPEAEAAQYMQQLISFLAHAHSKHIAHRDIKPENMLLAPLPDTGADKGDQCSPRWRLKVIDYGCSAFCIPGQKLHDAVGTVCYVAPEVLRHDYDAASDVWSAGVVLYMLLCGYLPFDGRNNEETLLLVRAGDFDMVPEDWSGVSAEGQQLVRSLLTYRAAERPTAAQLLKHSWVQHGPSAAAAAPCSPPADPAAAPGQSDKAPISSPAAVSVKATAGAPTGSTPGA